MKKLLIASSIVAAAVSSQAFAADQAGNANVDIVSAITIAETREVDFGTIVNVNGTCTMGSGGGLSGTAGMACSGTETDGLFTITGTTGSVVDISLSGGNSDATLVFNPVLDGAVSRTLTGGTTTANIIGNIVLTDTSDGDKDIAYTFTANYQ
ncbi:MAG: hypothetical protein AB8B86_13510 [Pseudomonadales bacterium]